MGIKFKDVRKGKTIMHWAINVGGKKILIPDTLLVRVAGLLRMPLAELEKETEKEEAVSIKDKCQTPNFLKLKYLLLRRVVTTGKDCVGAHPYRYNASELTRLCRELEGKGTTIDDLRKIYKFYIGYDYVAS